MTRFEFMNSLPDMIDRPGCGKGYLSVTFDNTNTKGAAYKHADNTTSYGQRASSWDELFRTMSTVLKESGHLN